MRIFFGFTNETYVHRNHSSKNSYMSNNSTMNRLSLKGQRLVILHAIAPFNPLCEREEMEYQGVILNGMEVLQIQKN